MAECTIYDKLRYIAETKDLIKAAIESQDVEVLESDAFKKYAQYITEIRKVSSVNGLQGDVVLKTINGVELTGSGDIIIQGDGGSIDLSDYYTREEIDKILTEDYVTLDYIIEKGFVVDYQLEEYAKKTDIPTSNAQLTNDAKYITLEEVPKTDLSNYATLDDIPSLNGYATEQWVKYQKYLTEVPSEYITEEELNGKGYLTEHQDLTDYAKKTDIPTSNTAFTNDAGYITLEEVPETDLSDYYTKEQTYSKNEVNDLLENSGSGVVTETDPIFTEWKNQRLITLGENNVINIPEDFEEEWASSVLIGVNNTDNTPEGNVVIGNDITIDNGIYNTVIGTNNKSLSSSVIIGTNNTDNAGETILIGESNTSNQLRQIALGRYNNPTTEGEINIGVFTKSEEDTYFAISSGHLKESPDYNAFEIKQNDNIHIRLNGQDCVLQDKLNDIKETDLSDYYTKGEVYNKNEVNELIDRVNTGDVDLTNYYTKQEVDNKIPSLNGYATEQWVEDKNYLTEHQSLEDYAKKSDIPTIPTSNTAFTNDAGFITLNEVPETDLTDYYTKTETYSKDEVDGLLENSGSGVEAINIGTSVQDWTQKTGIVSLYTQMYDGGYEVAADGMSFFGIKPADDTIIIEQGGGTVNGCFRGTIKVNPDVLGGGNGNAPTLQEGKVGTTDNYIYSDGDQNSNNCVLASVGLSKSVNANQVGLTQNVKLWGDSSFNGKDAITIYGASETQAGVMTAEDKVKLETLVANSGNTVGGSSLNVIELTQAEYDALSEKQTNAIYVITDAVELKFKTINGQEITGEGDIEISGGGGSTAGVNKIIMGEEDYGWNAYQGNVKLTNGWTDLDDDGVPETYDIRIGSDAGSSLWFGFNSTDNSIKIEDNGSRLSFTVNEWVGSQEDYDALGNYDNNCTYYII